jgi:hypothetical protein
MRPMEALSSTTAIAAAAAWQASAPSRAIPRRCSFISAASPPDRPLRETHVPHQPAGNRLPHDARFLFISARISARETSLTSSFTKLHGFGGWILTLFTGSEQLFPAAKIQHSVCLLFTCAA